MSRKLILAALGAAFAPALALAQPSELAHDQQALANAKEAHALALKSGDKARIAKTDAVMKAAYENVFNDKHDAEMAAQAPPTGETRAQEMALIKAKEDYTRALTSGDQAWITRSHEALRVAYAKDYAIRHPKHGKP